MVTLELEDSFEAAKKAGPLADQWAVVEAIEGDAVERDADKAYGFRVLQDKGIAVFALESVKQGTMIMCEKALLRTRKDASLEAVAKGFMQLSPGDQAIYLELGDGVTLGQQLVWQEMINKAVFAIGTDEWCWGSGNSALRKILAIR